MQVDTELFINNHKGFLPPMLSSLRALGISVLDDDWLPGEDVLRRAVACNVWFYDCLRYPFRVWRLKRRLEQFNIPLVAWNRDAPHYLNRKPWRLDLLNRFRLLDIYATHSLADEHRQFADTVLYLPNAADVASYNIGGDTEYQLGLLRSSSTYDWDVSFFGAMDGDRYKEMKARQEFFSALGDRLNGLGIRYLFREADGMTVGDQADLIKKSRISLNFGASCEYGYPQAFGLPERCYGIPAVGGFLLCDRRMHARDDFTVGENWAEFDGLDDCVSQIQYWLSHFDAARRLAEKCHHHVMEHHTYKQRAEKLLGAVQDWKTGRRGLIR